MQKQNPFVIIKQRESSLKKLIASSIFFLSAFVGVFYISNQFESNIEQASRRDPAAIRKSYDFSTLNGSALNSAARARLLEGATVTQQKDFIGIEFGHFVVKSAQGQKTFACQEYNQIQMIFEADGFAVSGERPQMTVIAPCQMSQNDINKIEVIRIPVASIVSEKVGDGDFTFNQGQNITVQFAYMPDQWPVQWHLKSLNLKNDSQNVSELMIEQNEIRQIIGKPLILDWSLTR